MANYDQPIIIKKVKKASHAHHGGAWKIAYADFVTAMMAFFLLMWLISMTTPEQKEGLADYFAPSALSVSTSGAGGVMGGNALDDSGNQMSGSSADVIEEKPASPQSAETGKESETGGPALESGSEQKASSESQYNLKAIDNQTFHSAAASIRQAWQSMPELTPFADNLMIEVTEDGLDVQIVDQQGRPMFPEGSKYPVEAARMAVAAIAPMLQQLNAQITISGHVAAGGRYDNPRYGAWELSADRANVIRATLGEFGLSDDRIKSVVGRATDDPFFPNDPYMAANERVRITVLHAPPPVPIDLQP